MGLENKFAYNMYNYHSLFFKNFDMTIKITKSDSIVTKQYNSDIFINILYFYIVEYLEEPSFKLIEYALKLITQRKLKATHNLIEYEFTIYAYNKRVTQIETFEDYKTLINECILFLNVLEENKRRLEKYEREKAENREYSIKRYSY